MRPSPFVARLSACAVKSACVMPILNPKGRLSNVLSAMCAAMMMYAAESTFCRACESVSAEVWASVFCPVPFLHEWTVRKRMGKNQPRKISRFIFLGGDGVDCSLFSLALPCSVTTRENPCKFGFCFRCSRTWSSSSRHGQTEQAPYGKILSASAE